MYSLQKETNEMSGYLPQILKQYCEIQREFKLERPLYVDRTLIGYIMMSFENERLFLIGGTVKEAAKSEVFLPLEILKGAQLLKWKVIIGAGERMFVCNGQNLKWEAPFAIKGVIVAKVKIAEIEATEIGLQKIDEGTTAQTAEPSF